MYTANILEASQVMLDLYAALMDHFDCDNNYTGYKFWKDPRATTPMQLAGTLYYHFPAHFYKALHTIHQYEEEHHELTTSLLKQKKITVVDIGAGVGTFSLALMDFLYKWSNSIKTELDVILIEPNTLTHKIAKKLITTYAAKTGIVLNRLEIISEPFPESRCLEQVCAVIERIPVESVKGKPGTDNGLAGEDMKTIKKKPSGKTLDIFLPTLNYGSFARKRCVGRG
ncbi:hypothetical protein [Neomoorella humiferrea]|uniref:hypothetical protein n=1 Tax=Neomoorella humiferrea TaxID=676965 RepID=UPI0011B299ED|nr:hypothetical protein [Moorella humiferrea]